MKKFTITLISFLCTIPFVYTQMYIGRDTLYGNEWIDYELTYYKMEVAQDGVYRISYQDLLEGGLIEDYPSFEGKSLQLHHLGREVSIYTSTDEVFGENDYIVFYGRKNDGNLDQHLYPNLSDQLHPEFSLFTDTSTYFLSVTQQSRTARIEEIENDLSDSNTKVDHCWQRKERYFTQYYSSGKEFGGETSARYGLAEGFFGEGGIANAGGDKKLSLNIEDLNLQPIAEDAQLQLGLFSKGGSHDYTVMVNDNQVFNDAFNDWDVKNYEISVPNQYLKKNTNIQIQAIEGEEDKFYFSSYALLYPSTLDANGKDYFEFALDASEERLQIEIQNFEYGGSIPILYNLEDNYQIIGSIENDLVKFAIPPSFAGKRSFIMINPTKYLAVENIQKRTFVHYPLEDRLRYDYIILTHPKLYQSSSNTNYVEAYVTYRASREGGSFSPIAIDVTQIYDQYSYGIKRHEQGMKNFLKLASNSWKSTHLLILGKGVDKGIMRNQEKRIAENWDRFDLVPTFGQPHSDYLLVMDHDNDIPWMAVGRVAAYNSDQLRIYLNKVKEFDAIQRGGTASIEEKAWMKRILHFGGGDARIQIQIQSDFAILKQSIEYSTFGGNVNSFFKSSVDIVQEIPQTEQVRKLIDGGAAMIVFYGHSSPTTLDFDIGKPEEYNNKGRYPIFYAIGCNTNTVFSVPSSLSEDYVFIEDKGTIGFFGSTSLTQLSNLSRYARTFYENYGTENYGQTIGEIIRATIIDYEVENTFTSQHIKHVLMFHGDPALKLYPHEYSDFLLNKKASSINPEVINAQLDSFQAKLEIVNIGRAIQDSILITINQVFPDQKKQHLQTIQINAPRFDTLLNLQLPVLKNNNKIGKNQLEVIVDANNDIEEGNAQAEANNTKMLPFFVVDNDIQPIIPNNYGIVSTPQVTLSASSTNTFSKPIDYYIEIDTTADFNSPMKRSNQIQQSGGLLSWTPALVLEKDIVYYWRVSIDSSFTTGRGFNWRGSSFTYLPESSDGWNQSHHQQLDDNQLNRLEIEEYKQRFGERIIEFGVTTAAIPTLGFFAINITRDGFVDYAIGNCGSGLEALWMASYDPNTLQIRRRGADRPGSFSCWGTDHYLFSANLLQESERGRIIEFVEEEVPDGDYVIVLTTKRVGRDYEANQWLADSLVFGKNIFQVFEEHGATQIRNLLERETPYLLIFQKGNSDFVPLERHAINDEEIIELKASFIGQSDKGNIKTETIGPATAWEHLFWETSKQEAQDSVSVDIFGINQEGEEVLLHKKVMAFDTTLAHISADQYPQLKLNWNSKDEMNLTTPQLEFWRVLYEPLPELALAPNLAFDLQSDTLQKGESLKMKLAIANIGSIDVDSLAMRYTLIDRENREQQFELKEKALKSQDTLIANLLVETAGLNGKYQLLVEANPKQNPREQFFFNNTGATSFFVEVDERNPLLDVTFDGVRIMNGDIVGAKPQITVNLRDENKYLALNDTSLMQVGVLYPSGELRKFYFGSDMMEFTPADENNLEKENIAKIEFEPIFKESGTYQLQLLAKDRVGNQSGEYLYTVDFEVITESQISNVFNYPNPFSTSTQFVFTLTGSELPEDMRIQIMTVSGRVVREITMAELGNVHIGNNRTQFKWDGTDEFGDRLANGVYLYRILIKGQNDTEFEKFETNTDQYFEGGIGKMVIIR